VAVPAATVQRSQPQIPRTQAELPTTDGAIAASNFLGLYQLSEQTARAQPDKPPAQRVGLLLTHAQYFGALDDYDAALVAAERLVAQHPTVPEAWQARASARQSLHEFAGALADLARAEKLGADRDSIDAARAGIFAAVGRYDEALAIRTRLDVATIMPAVRNVVYGTGKDQPVYEVRTMQQVVSESMSSQRLPMVLLGVFAALALLLASVGIYGLISYSVSQRVQEMGIRMALGAQRASVFRMVIWQGLVIALTGIGIGAIGALILARAISSFSNLLYGVGAGDPLTFGSISLLLITIAFIACFVPAQRAMRTEPMIALRHE